MAIQEFFLKAVAAVLEEHIEKYVHQ